MKEKNNLWSLSKNPSLHLTHLTHLKNHFFLRGYHFWASVYNLNFDFEFLIFLMKMWQSGSLVGIKKFFHTRPLEKTLCYSKCKIGDLGQLQKICYKFLLALVFFVHINKITFLDIVINRFSSLI